MLHETLQDNQHFDFSTINLAVLESYPVYKKPPTYHISGHAGMGCAGDAPGFPSYFLRSVYTQHGNSGRGNPVVIQHPNGTLYKVGSDKEPYTAASLKKLWKPLPLDHPRVQAWIAHTYWHFHDMYIDHSEKEYGQERHIYWKLPEPRIMENGDVIGRPLIAGLNLFKTTLPRPSWILEHLAKWGTDDMKEQIEKYFGPNILLDMHKLDIVLTNGYIDDLRYSEYVSAALTLQQMYLESKLEYITPQNHMAVRAIRKFYPQHQPDIAKIEHSEPATIWQEISDWWQKHAVPFEEDDHGYCFRDEHYNKFAHIACGAKDHDKWFITTTKSHYINEDFCAVCGERIELNNGKSRDTVRA